MKKIYIPALIALVTLASCSKELSSENHADANTQQSLIGTWNFVSLSAKTAAVGQYTEAGSSIKMVTYTDYVSLNAKGKVIFDVNTVTSQGISYSIDTVMRAYYYLNNVLTDSLTAPLQLTIPPAGASVPYKLIGSDSLYFASGGFFSQGISGGGSTVPVGVRFSISGNRMTLRGKSGFSYTNTSKGVPITMDEQIAFTIILQKQ